MNVKKNTPVFPTTTGSLFAFISIHVAAVKKEMLFISMLNPHYGFYVIKYKKNKVEFWGPVCFTLAGALLMMPL